jgi:hypothetical protein
MGGWCAAHQKSPTRASSARGRTPAPSVPTSRETAFSWLAEPQARPRAAGAAPRPRLASTAALTPGVGSRWSSLHPAAVRTAGARRASLQADALREAIALAAGHADAADLEARARFHQACA